MWKAMLGLSGSPSNLIGKKYALSRNLQKSGINTYTWDFGMYDTSSER